MNPEGARASPSTATAARRWPAHPGWDEMATAVETLAAACGGHACCSQKHERLRVELQRPARTPEQTAALHMLAELIEQVSDMERDDAWTIQHVRLALAGRLPPTDAPGSGDGATG